ncbi:MAG: M14 family metallopeptidase [Burkholderiales bacterium]
MTDFAESYPVARGRFFEAVDAFEAGTGRSCARARHAVGGTEDLTVDVAHFEPRERRRLLLVTSGVHGIEGYAGNAIQRALLGGPLARLAGDCGVMLVHAVNPWGMAHFRRVNPNNVDLNRNFAAAGDALYRTRNPGYRLIAEALAPPGPCAGALASRARLLGGLSAAALLNGYATLRQALLAGQYDAPEGLFYGGAGRQRETRVFADLFEPCCARYDEILLIDLHTGYGARGRVQLLRGVAGPRERIGPATAYAGGPNAQGYSVTGDLVAFCRRTAGRIKPRGVFEGIVVEVGTSGLSMWSQLHDLGTLVRENQLHPAAHPGDRAGREGVVSRAVPSHQPRVAARGTRRRACGDRGPDRAPGLSRRGPARRRIAGNFRELIDPIGHPPRLYTGVTRLIRGAAGCHIAPWMGIR